MGADQIATDTGGLGNPVEQHGWDFGGGDCQWTGGPSTARDSRRVRLEDVYCLCRVTWPGKAASGWLLWDGEAFAEQMRAVSGSEALQHSIEYQSEVKQTQVQPCVMGWGFGFQGTFMNTRSTVETNNFLSSRKELNTRTPFPSLQPPSLTRDQSHPCVNTENH